DLPLADEYQTLGGFLIYQMQKIPVVGEQFLYNTCKMTVETAEGPRLDKIQIRRQLPMLEEQDESEQEEVDPPNVLSEPLGSENYPEPRENFTRTLDADTDHL
ncbi:MAG: hypothetical protein LH679_05840, partial [Cyanobacteria bacterium CAN_BIN43]|nr:hypothetical protein [Cyanobacteria bacterium CAN_BIN43]